LLRRNTSEFTNRSLTYRIGYDITNSINGNIGGITVLVDRDGKPLLDPKYTK